MAKIKTATPPAAAFLKTAFLKTLVLKLFLLIGIAALPAFAFAVDTDGDGVDDGVDAFPNNIEASADTDGDGIPDSFVRAATSSYIFDSFEGGSISAGWTSAGNGWRRSGNYGPYGASHYEAFTLIGGRPVTASLSRSMVLTQTVTASWFQYGDGYYTVAFSGAPGTPVCSDTSLLSVQFCQLTISPGSYTLIWTLHYTDTCSLGPCLHYDGLDHVVVSNLFEDLDDDNDGVADTGDAFPQDNTQAGDVDADGVEGLLDNCPSNANADQLNTDGDTQGNVCDSDDDNDNVLDTADQCPLDPSCTLDADGDGIDNTVDPDDDNDTVLDGADNCPLNANTNQADTDGDGLPDACTDTDDDNDGVADTSDKFPLNAAASSDTDVDGFPGSWNAACNTTCQANSGLVLDNCPSNANADQLNTDGDTQGNVCDSDDDNDGVVDTADAYPLDDTQAGDIDADGIDGFVDNCPSAANSDQLNTDGDAKGNACDTDDDNDGVADTSDKFPLNAAAWSDSDNDGFPGSWNGACDATCQANSGLVLDNCPSNANVDQLNADGDTQGDVCDTDDDNDGVADTSDKFPLHVAASSDTDADGFPGSWNPACDATCQASSELVLDNCPSNANADQLNTDGDTKGNVCDSDDDNDGMPDVNDAFPLNAAETLDTDLDGIGNNADPDDDNDGLPDAMDPLPLQAKFNLNAPYKGSQIGDQSGVQ